MKKLQDIQKELDGLQTIYPRTESREIKKMAKRRKFLTVIRNFLETNPPEQFVKNSLKIVKNDLKVMKSRRMDWNPPKGLDPKKYNSQFNKEFGITKLQNQVATMQFILEDK